MRVTRDAHGLTAESSAVVATHTYRHVGAPRPVPGSATTFALPQSNLRRFGEHPADRAVPASRVMAGAIGGWTTRVADGPTALRRSNPNVSFAGIGKICGTLPLGFRATTAAIILPNSRVLIIADDGRLTALPGGITATVAAKAGLAIAPNDVIVGVNNGALATYRHRGHK